MSCGHSDSGFGRSFSLKLLDAAVSSCDTATTPLDSRAFAMSSSVRRAISSHSLSKVASCSQPEAEPRFRVGKSVAAGYEAGTKKLPAIPKAPTGILVCLLVANGAVCRGGVLWHRLPAKERTKSMDDSCGRLP